MSSKNNSFSLSRRNFLKISAAVSATAGLGLGANMLNIKEVSAEESEKLAKSLGNVEVKYTADVMCPSECAMEMWVKDGRIVKIYGNDSCPFNDGACCAKGASGMQLVYSPDRNKYPMIREGERGEGKFRRATWEEAIDYIGKKLVDIKKNYGAESVIMDCGDVTDRDQYYRLFHAYGTPNCVEHGSICDTPRRHGPKLMLGGKRIEPDVMRPVLVRQPDGSLKKDYTYYSKLIIYVGWNPFVATRINYESRGTVGAKVENGCKVIVVDPAHTNTASQADLWMPIRPGTDGDLFAAMLRYILENDNQNNPLTKYIDWSFKELSVGWDEFEKEFKTWWGKNDPINGKSYFSLDWAADRTGLPKEQIAQVAHEFGITKPAALVWGMQSPGHHFNGYPASILGTALNIITGNIDVPGGAIDTELVKSDKGGDAKGSNFKKKKVKRVIGDQEVESEVESLHMDWYGDWPAAWDDVVGDYPRRFREGVTLNYGPFKGHKYPIKGFMIRTGNPVMTGGNTRDWIDALTAKDSNGNYKVELVVNIDTLYLETGMYADVILPEASYAERMSLSDVYPSHQVLWLRDRVINPLHEAKCPTDIMNMLAKKFNELGDSDFKASDFWDKYKSEEDFVNEMLAPAPGRNHAGEPVPYPHLPLGYKLIGTPDSLDAGRVTIDHEKKTVKGEPVTVDWMRNNKGVAVWPMSWNRFKIYDKEAGKHVASKAVAKTNSKLFEFTFSGYDKYNKLISETGIIPRGLKEIGYDKYPNTFYWFETKWNPYTNTEYAKYKDEYPFQLICGRVHHAMTGTQMVPWLSETPVEGIWMPLNNSFKHKIIDMNAKGELEEVEKEFMEGTLCVGTIAINASDAKALGLKTGDLAILENPLGAQEKGKVFVTEGMRPGTIKLGFGTGGRFSPGIGPTSKSKDYTPNHSGLVDPNAHSPIMGMPCYADMIIKVEKA
ncbi:molybdopterin oxidoreductase [Desulfitobacterium hafniense DCB-2]|uniref:Molybdopterin oxidoreductase n=1 Tax=Desulfitobacterium hafniense (strain DSM 10664 / DCB-2) TaxID=272564 RepID=B8G151_DESHD|nr:molybdopterin-dependent oxidoreductase [Desulfitobacterium hafniense]ACL19266.1 molybdopterin oxidoreductase [Desulfitobacterium hafniense DCB-2]